MHLTKTVWTIHLLSNNFFSLFGFTSCELTIFLAILGFEFSDIFQNIKMLICLIQRSVISLTRPYRVTTTKVLELQSYQIFIFNRVTFFSAFRLYLVLRLLVFCFTIFGHLSLSSKRDEQNSSNQKPTSVRRDI